MGKRKDPVHGGVVGPVTEVPASEVKNAWHEFIDRVSRGREEIVVTRYGKPVMKLSPVDEPEDRPGIFGFLAGTVTVHGDIVAPTGEAWEADA
jgi:prevent-host-death family protein